MKKTRKIALLLTAGLVLASLLGGCVSTAPASNAPAGSTASTTAPTTSHTPGEEVTLRIVDWSDSSKVFREEFHEKFEQEHPGVTIEYTCLTIDEFRNNIVSLITSGDGPDLFPVPAGMSLAAVQKENWYQSMDTLVTEEFKEKLDPIAFQEGISMLGGKLYSMPEQIAIPSTVIFYNKDVLDKAGVTELPKTYSEFVAVCKQVTQAGNGDFYGFVEGGQQNNRVDALIRTMTGVAGGKIGGTASQALTVGGRAPYDSAEVKAVFDLFIQLNADGSIHPDTLNINAPVAREYFAQGQAAFLSQGMWCIGAWAGANPNLNYGVMPVPTPDDGGTGAVQLPAMAPWLGIYSQSKNPQLAAEYLMCLYSEEYDYQMQTVDSGAYLSLVNGLNEKYMSNEVMKQYYEEAQKQSKTIPFATTRDAAVFDFYGEVKDVEPGMAAIWQGLLSGSITSYEEPLKNLADATTKEWQRAASVIGIDYGVFEFENWDVSKDYTQADYDALK